MADWGFRRLGELQEKWPKDEAGEPEEPVFLEHLGGSELDVEMGLAPGSRPALCALRTFSEELIFTCAG